MNDYVAWQTLAKECLFACSKEEKSSLREILLLSYKFEIVSNYVFSNVKFCDFVSIPLDATNLKIPSNSEETCISFAKYIFSTLGKINLEDWLYLRLLMNACITYEYKKYIAASSENLNKYLQICDICEQEAVQWWDNELVQKNVNKDKQYVLPIQIYNSSN